MIKNTINKAFQKEFPNIIWKIEVDSFSDRIGIETRAPDTYPIYSIFDFGGNMLMPDYRPGEKEWVMEGLQKDFLILKKIGENTPIKEGIRVIHIPSGQEVFTSFEYKLEDVYEDYILVRHRTVDLSRKTFLRISDGSVHGTITKEELPPNRVVLPIASAKIPPLFSEEKIIDNIWLSKSGDNFLWCYHRREAEGYCLILSISDLNQITHQAVILRGMDKMIPQPYFQVGQQLFFLSNNKQEIVSYLV